MKLYTYFQSSASYRARIALSLKGLKPEMEYINLTKGEQENSAYAAVNPQMVVPALIDKGHKLSQSLAIMEYLEENYPAPAILPKDPFARAYVRELALVVAADISPFGNLKVRKYLEVELKQDKDARQKWVQHWVNDGLAAFEKILVQEKKAGRFCYGDTPTMADCCLIPQLFNAQRFKCDLTPFPNILHIAENCSQHPAFIEAHPSKQKDVA